MRRASIALLGIVLLTGCHESGTWKDDPRNWTRIFEVPKPDDITVVHSWFWRSAHFTYEYRYYLQVRNHADFQKRLLTLNPMKEVVGEKELRDAVCWWDDHPDWFAPKPIVQYRVWIPSEEPKRDFRVLIDRETGDLFLYDCQL